jgi:hypothetical protein
MASTGLVTQGIHSVNGSGIDRGHRIQRSNCRRCPTLTQILPGKETRSIIVGVTVEATTYDWYGLVDALMEASYRVHLANTVALV